VSNVVFRQAHTCITESAYPGLWIRAAPLVSTPVRNAAQYVQPSHKYPGRRSARLHCGCRQKQRSNPSGHRSILRNSAKHSIRRLTSTRLGKAACRPWCSPSICKILEGRLNLVVGIRSRSPAPTSDMSHVSYAWCAVCAQSIQVEMSRVPARPRS
jgi:hypothetical protein